MQFRVREYNQSWSSMINKIYEHFVIWFCSKSSSRTFSDQFPPFSQENVYKVFWSNILTLIVDSFLASGIDIVSWTIGIWVVEDLSFNRIIAIVGYVIVDH
jgi:hypothetical protein